MARIWTKTKTKTMTKTKTKTLTGDVVLVRRLGEGGDTQVELLLGSLPPVTIIMRILNLLRKSNKLSLFTVLELVVRN